jgi:site-specific recombinase XerD
VKETDMTPEVYSDETFHQVLGALGRGYLADRNRALLALGRYAGLRCAELLALHPCDLVAQDQGDLLVHVRRGKGAKQRVSVCLPEARPYLTELLAWREKLELPDTAPLFCSKQGKRLGTGAVRMLLSRLRKRAGVDQRLHAHGLRHTHAVELASDGVPTIFIRDQLGHSRLSTTETYVSHVSPARLLAALRRA